MSTKFVSIIVTAFAALGFFGLQNLQAQGPNQYDVSFGSAVARVTTIDSNHYIVKMDTVCTTASIGSQPGELFKLAAKELLLTNAFGICDPNSDQWNNNYPPGEWPCNNEVIIRFPMCYTIEVNYPSTCIIPCASNCYCEVKLVYCYTSPGGYEWLVKNTITPPPAELYPRLNGCPPYGQDQCPGVCLEGECSW
ncbi:MAG: hypothetical protein HYX66_04065 [Ignavibacteria bacterium]|nr:hypothetical protein [Ignavibacteria bacterium]